MQKKIFSIWSILLVLVISLAVLVPGCTGEGEGEGEGTIEVRATLCGVLWEGAVDYTLTPAVGAPINGTSVNATHSVAAGNWTCAYDGGGPAGAFLDNIAPSATQEVSEGATITFTLEFELNQDAWIDCLGWTKNGQPYLDDYMYLEPCNWLDVHFMQGVLGCDGYQVAVNETSWLQITQTGGPPGVSLFVINDPCAVNKTPEPIQKVSQNTTLEEVFVNPGDGPFSLDLQIPVNLDVETIWTLVKEVDYEKAINWFGVSVVPFVPPGQHPCVLFELVMPGPGVYTFTLVASAEVALMDDVDVNTQNDKATCPQTLYLTVTVP